MLFCFLRQLTPLKDQIDALIKRQEAGEDVAAEIARLTEEKASQSKMVKVNRNTRLDNRIIDLRTRANNAIFRIQVCCVEF